MIMSEKLVDIARITEAHGLKGQVKIRYDGDNPSILSHPDGLILEESDRRLHVKVIKPSSKGLICAIEGVKDRNAAEDLRQKTLYLERDKLPEHDDENDFYITDLVGLQVFDDDGEEQGAIKMVDNFGAGDLLLITTPEGEDFYLPFTADTVPEVDIDGGKIIIAPPDGYVE